MNTYSASFGHAEGSSACGAVEVCGLGPMEGPGTREAPRGLASLLPALPVEKENAASASPAGVIRQSACSGVFQPHVAICDRRRAGCEGSVRNPPRRASAPADHTVVGVRLAIAAFSRI